MVLYQGQPVARLELPAELQGKEPSDPTLIIEATGDVCKDREQHTERMAFLQSKVFTCELNGLSGIDYFEAARLEREEQEFLNTRFPQPLKGRVLRAVHLRAQRFLDILVDVIFERLEDRFFEDERVFVSVGQQRYFGRIVHLRPCKSLHDLALARAASAGHPPDALLPPNPFANNSAFGAVAHIMGTDLDIDADEADQMDDPRDYTYVVQLMDDAGQFNGSILDMRANQLSRDRQAYTKPILKRFIVSSCERKDDSNAPWRVRPRLVEVFSLPPEETPEITARNQRLIEGHTVKRKRTAEQADAQGAPPPKRAAMDVKPATAAAEAAAPPANGTANGPTPDAAPPRSRRKPAAAAPKPAAAPQTAKKRAPKGPVDDLDLDSAASLAKPAFDLDFDVDAPNVDAFLSVWSCLNNFGDSLTLSNFSLDDFGRALAHPTHDPPCTLINEMHAVLLNEIVANNLRFGGTVNANSSLPLPQLAGELAGFDDGMDAEERRRFIKRGFVHTRRWDRSARLKHKQGRRGWQRYMIGALCTRGGLQTIPSLPRILKHLFNGEAGAFDGVLDEVDELEAEPEKPHAAPASGNAGEDEDESEEGDAAAPVDVPAQQYFSLPVSDKLAILRFLCEVCVSSRKIRQYLDNTENVLKELQKDRLELNKAHRELATKKTAALKAIKTEGKVELDRDGKPPRDEDGEYIKDKSVDAYATLEVDLESNELTAAWSDREIRRCLQIVRTTPLGYDRFMNSYWWLDGIGSQDLISANETALYGMGRLLVQGASEADRLALSRRVDGGEGALERKRQAEEGKDATPLSPGQWAALTTEEQIDQLLTWFNPKGRREHALHAELTKWRSYIVGGMQKRHRDLQVPLVKLPKAPIQRGGRRSKRIGQDDTEAAPPPPPQKEAFVPEPTGSVARYLAYINKAAVL